VALEPKVPRITKEELKPILDNPGVIVLDVRIGDEWKKSDKKIKGAIREDPEKDFKVWALNYQKDKTIVFYWSWPNEETSAWMARQFISMGYQKVFVLKGGWDEWYKANFPVEPKWSFGLHDLVWNKKGWEKMKRKDSQLFKPLVDTSEKYLRDYCDGKQEDDNRAKIALRVLSLYRQILKVEKEREQIKSEWQKLITGVAELKKVTARKPKRKQGKSLKKIKSKCS
jgi:rhodanese-related sulfurtransferase